MNAKPMTADEVRRTGLDALVAALRVVGMVRFPQQFETGHGDYITDRDRLLPDESVAVLAEKIRSVR